MFFVVFRGGLCLGCFVSFCGRLKHWFANTNGKVGEGDTRKLRGQESLGSTGHHQVFGDT